MKKLLIFVTISLLGAASALAQEPTTVLKPTKETNNYWFAGVGGGINLAVSGDKYEARWTRSNGAGYDLDVYVGKWLNDLAGFRIGWQGLNISDRYTDFGRDDYTYIHGDVLLRPLSWLVPYAHVGYVKMDKGYVGGGLGIAFPIKVSKRIAIVPDLRATAYTNSVWEEGKSRFAATFTPSVGIRINLGGRTKMKETTIPVPYEVVREVEKVVRDTVYIDRTPDVVAKTAEVNEFLRNVTLFDWDSAEIRPEAEDGLNKVVDWMSRYPNVTAKVEGHTDNTGTDEYNQGLSERRCQAIVNYLVEKGVDASRLSYEGFGASRPVATNDTWAGRQQNRRIEMIFSANE